MRAGNRQTEDIGSQLAGRSALAAAAGHTDLRDGYLRALFGSFLAFPQGISQTFQNSPVEMSAGMHVAEADHRAARFRPGVAQPGRPIRLQHQTL